MTSGRQHLMTSCPQAFTVTAPEIRWQDCWNIHCRGSLLPLGSFSLSAWKLNQPQVVALIHVVYDFSILKPIPNGKMVEREEKASFPPLKRNYGCHTYRKLFHIPLDRIQSRHAHGHAQLQKKLGNVIYIFFLCEHMPIKHLRA